MPFLGLAWYESFWTQQACTTQALQWCHTFVAIGESFSNCADPGNLADQLANVGYSYFRSSHPAVLQELYTSQSSETWLPLCQLPSGYPPRPAAKNILGFLNGIQQPWECALRTLFRLMAVFTSQSCTQLQEDLK